jgi:hypothetical protein
MYSSVNISDQDISNSTTPKRKTTPQYTSKCPVYLICESVTTVLVTVDTDLVQDRISPKKYIFKLKFYVEF